MPRDPSARGRDPSWPEKPDVAPPFVECQFPPTPQPMVGDPSTTTTPCAPLGLSRRRPVLSARGAGGGQRHAVVGAEHASRVCDYVAGRWANVGILTSPSARAGPRCRGGRGGVAPRDPFFVPRRAPLAAPEVSLGHRPSWLDVRPAESVDLAPQC